MMGLLLGGHSAFIPLLLISISLVFFYQLQSNVFLVYYKMSLPAIHHFLLYYLITIIYVLRKYMIYNSILIFLNFHEFWYFYL